MMPSTSVSLDIETLVTLDVPKVAVSDDPLGTVVGFQLAPVFQSPLDGELDHCALPARNAGKAVTDKITASRRDTTLVLGLSFFIEEQFRG